jgi:hypothetical protein
MVWPTLAHPHHGSSWGRTVGRNKDNVIHNGAKVIPFAPVNYQFIREYKRLFGEPPMRDVKSHRVGGQPADAIEMAQVVDSTTRTKAVIPLDRGTPQAHVVQFNKSISLLPKELHVACAK